MTVASGSTTYCTVAQFVTRTDDRSVRQLLSDSGAPVTGSLSSNATLTSILMEASGWVEAAATAGQRYVITDTRNDLADLADSGTNTAEMLAGVVARLAWFILWGRRPNQGPADRVPAACQQALDFLEQLRLGERVFGLLENQEAAALESNTETAGDVERRNGVIVLADRYFGLRSGRLRL